MGLSKSEEQVIRKVVSRLRGESASDEIRDLLTNREHGAGLYLETWVIPMLTALLPESRDIEYAKRAALR